MKIWVDADACPVVIKEILFKAAIRTETETILVANHTLSIPPNPLIKFMQVPGGFDVADNKIMQQLAPQDLVITQDIPLAAEVVAAGALAINPRGELYTPSNIKARLQMRDFMESLRSSGIQTGGPAAFSQADRQAFANQLDRILTQRKKTAN